MMKVSVVIPTLNAQAYLRPLLEALIAQTVEPEVLVVDSSSDDATARIAANFAGRVRFESIARADFDHGATRDWALRQTGGDIVCFISQDALPADTQCLQRLCATLERPEVAAAFGRQTARRNASAHERLVREFNYPGQSRVWSEADIPRMGMKAYFFSDTFSAYRRGTYLAVGGFERPVSTNEDMLMAATLLHAGYSLAYVAEAVVFHSHDNTLQQDFRRHQASGFVMETHREQLTGADANAEGLRMVSSVCSNLAKEGNIAQIPPFIAHVAARFLGNRTGALQARRKA